MRRKKVTVTGVANSAWIPVDREQAPFALGFGVTVDSGTATYTVQHTFDEVFDTTVTPTAWDHATIVGQTTKKDGNYAFPITAMRLSVTVSSGGTCSMTMIQGVK